MPPSMPSPMDGRNGQYDAGHSGPHGAGAPYPEPLQGGRQSPAGERDEQCDDRHGHGADAERLLTVGYPQPVLQQWVRDQPHQDGRRHGQGRNP